MTSRFGVRIMEAVGRGHRRIAGVGRVIMRLSVRLAVVLVFACASPVFAQTMYARTAATVRADKKLSAPVVASLKQGDAVTVRVKEGSHYKVSVGGKEGWIYYNKLAEHKPEDVAALLGADPARPIVLTELEAGGALRGLSPMAENYAKGADIPEWATQAVENMQGLGITAEELESFAREGRLGEYGEEQ